MAANRMEILLVLAAIASFWAVIIAQSSCTNTIVSLSPCLNYTAGNSSAPTSGCCTQLANVVQSDPQCLCQILNGGGSSLGVSINQTRALALPKACNVQTPPASRCNGTTTPSTNNGYSTKVTFSLVFSLVLTASVFTTS